MLAASAGGGGARMPGSQDANIHLPAKAVVRVLQPDRLIDDPSGSFDSTGSPTPLPQRSGPLQLREDQLTGRVQVFSGGLGRNHAGGNMAPTTEWQPSSVSNPQDIFLTVAG